MKTPLHYVAYYRVTPTGREPLAKRHNGRRSTWLPSLPKWKAGRGTQTGHSFTRPLQERLKEKATLVVANLDRLAHNVHFITGLIESKVDCCHNPHANKAMLQMLAVFAEHEREMISQRTKAALAAAKARGTVLGNPALRKQGQHANQKPNGRKSPPEIIAPIQSLRGQGRPLRAIADELNRMHITTPRGGEWYASSVSNQIER